MVQQVVGEVVVAAPGAFLVAIGDDVLGGASMPAGHALEALRHNLAGERLARVLGVQHCRQGFGAEFRFGRVLLHQRKQLVCQGARRGGFFRIHGLERWAIGARRGNSFAGEPVFHDGFFLAVADFAAVDLLVGAQGVEDVRNAALAELSCRRDFVGALESRRGFQVGDNLVARSFHRGHF